MAIKIKQVKKRGGIGRLITIVVILALIIGGAYALFFAPTPAFEYISSPEIERNRQLSTFEINPRNVLDSPEFRKLRKFDSDISVGSFGKSNPFVP